MGALESKLIDFLDIDIEDDDEILTILAQEVPILELINQDLGCLLIALNLRALYDFIKDWNEEYCDAHELCHKCRIPLQEVVEQVPFGDYTVPMIDSRCPNCGY